MALEYLVSFPCKVRESLSNEELLRMARARARAQAALDVMRERPGQHTQLPESEWTFTLSIRRGQTEQKAEVRIADLLRESEPLAALAEHCTDCPANILRTPFGCGGAISYPISVRGERWLLDRLPDVLPTPRGWALRRALASGAYDGSSVDAQRGRADLFAARQAPEREWPYRKWAGLFGPHVRITSSQILEMMLLLGEARLPHVRLLVYALGFIQADGTLCNDPGNRPRPDDDQSIFQLKHFFALIALAVTCNVPVLIDA